MCSQLFVHIWFSSHGAGWRLTVLMRGEGSHVKTTILYILYLNPISVFFFSFLLHCLSKNLIICKTVSFKLMTFYISVFRWRFLSFYIKSNKLHIRPGCCWTISSVWSSLWDQRQELSSELRNAAQGTVASTRYVRAITETRGDMRARTELNTPHPQQSPRTKQSLYSSLCSLPFRRPDTGPVMDA